MRGALRGGRGVQLLLGGRGGLVPDVRQLPREVPDTDATAVTYRKGSYLFLEADETGTDAARGPCTSRRPRHPPPPPPPFVLSGHAASLTPY